MINELIQTIEFGEKGIVMGAIEWTILIVAVLVVVFGLIKRD